MRSSLRIIIKAATAVLFAGLVFGCGNVPTAPEENPTEVSGRTNGQHKAAPAALIADLVQTVDDATTAVVEEVNVVGEVGAQLSNGRWSVSVPSGAVSGEANVSISVENLLSSTCDLEILPASKNQFAKPVML